MIFKRLIIITLFVGIVIGLFKYRNEIAFLIGYVKFRTQFVRNFDLQNPNYIFYLSGSNFVRDKQSVYRIEGINLNDASDLDIYVNAEFHDRLEPYFGNFVQLRGNLTAAKFGGMYLKLSNISKDDKSFIKVNDFNLAQIVKVERYYYYDPYQTWDKDTYVYKDSVYKDSKKEFSCATESGLFENINSKLKSDLTNVSRLNPEKVISPKDITFYDPEFILTLADGQKVALHRRYNRTVLCANSLDCNDKTLGIPENREESVVVNPLDLLFLNDDNLYKYLWELVRTSPTESCELE